MKIKKGLEKGREVICILNPGSLGRTEIIGNIICVRSANKNNYVYIEWDDLVFEAKVRQNKFLVTDQYHFSECRYIRLILNNLSKKLTEKYINYYLSKYKNHATVDPYVLLYNDANTSENPYLKQQKNKFKKAIMLK